jgi:hypothetical protein
MMHIHIANLLIIRGRPKDALAQGVKGYMSLERRTKDAWLRNLFEFVHILTANVQQFGPNMSGEDPAFLTKAQLQDVVHGHLYELNLAASKVFGSQSKYTQALQVCYSNCYSNHIESAGTPRPGTDDFARRFKTAQAKLLLWAGVDEDKGITLSS